MPEEVKPQPVDPDMPIYEPEPEDKPPPITPIAPIAVKNTIDRGDFLAPGAKLHDDMRLVAKAARNGWGVSDAVKRSAVKRLAAIVEKPTVAVPDGNGGTVQVDLPADQNAIAAARTLATLDTIDQTDHWNEDKNERLDKGKATEITGVRIIVPGLPQDGS